jgi:hypothetical protein
MPAQPLKTCRDQSGIALVAALAVVLVVLPVAAFVVLQAAIDLRVQHNLRAATEAFYIAEAGLEHAVADIMPAASLQPLLAGPDVTWGSSDDGSFPFVDGPPAHFPYAPKRYEVSVEDAGDGVIRIRSRGVGIGAAVAVVEARVALSPSVFTPGAVYTEAVATSVSVSPGRTRISGFDHRAGEPPGAASGAEVAVPGIALSDADEAEALRTRLTGGAGAAVSGAGGTPSIAAAGGAFDVASYAAALRGDPDASRYAAALADPDWLLGTEVQPRASVVLGDFEVSGRLRGHGVLFVDGALRVRGTLSWFGLVIVAGDVEFAAGSRVTLSGALWQSAAGALRLFGNSVVVYSSDRLQVADAAFPGKLPRIPRVVAWREVL